MVLVLKLIFFVSGVFFVKIVVRVSGFDLVWFLKIMWLFLLMM